MSKDSPASRIRKRATHGLHSRRIGGGEAIMGPGVDKAAKQVGFSAMTDDEGNIFMRSGMSQEKQEQKMTHEQVHSRLGEHKPGQNNSNHEEDLAQSAEFAHKMKDDLAHKMVVQKLSEEGSTYGKNDGALAISKLDPQSIEHAQDLLKRAAKGEKERREADGEMGAYNNLIAQKYSHAMVVETLMRKIKDDKAYNSKMVNERSGGNIS